MPLQPFFIKVTPGEINGNLAAQGGKLLFHVPNYTEIFEAPPAVNDESHQVFLVGVNSDEVRPISDGGVGKFFVWKGDPQARSKPQDKASLEVLSLTPFVQFGEPAASAVADPVEAAKVAFAGLPAEVQLAAALQANTVEAISKLPEMSPARVGAVQMWARFTVDEYVKAQSGAAKAT